MIVLDYLIYVTHNFLLLVNKVNPYNLRERSVNAVSLMLFFLCFLIVSAIYMLLINVGFLAFNKIIYFIACILSFVLIYSFINKRYKAKYDFVIELLDRKLNYNNRTFIILFLLIWFIPLVSFWGGLLFIRSLLR